MQPASYRSPASLPARMTGWTGVTHLYFLFSIQRHCQPILLHLNHQALLHFIKKLIPGSTLSTPLQARPDDRSDAG